MVVGAKTVAVRRAVIVPDEQTWTVLGRDPAALGYVPASNPGGAAALLAPESVPEPLSRPVDAVRQLMSSDASIELSSLPIFERASAQHGVEHDQHPGHGGHARDEAHDAHGEHRSAQHGAHHQDDHHHAASDERGHGAYVAPSEDEHRGHGGHDHGDHPQPDHHHHGTQDHDEHSPDHHDEHAAHEHDGHGGHHDMMAIVGEPSADGLIMEPIPVMYGPLATPLPGGLIAEVTLDGDVVDESAVRATLRADASGIPDPLAPVAWTLAMAISSGGQDAAPQWLTVAALELERAISHLAWLRSLARLLNWSPLIDACTRALAAIQVSREVLPLGDAPEPWLRAALGDPDLPAGRAALSEVVALVSGSRMLRWRLKHRAELTASDVRDLELTGPIARASGHAWDARSADARYRDLGFQPVTQTDGDAYARTLVRAEEAAQALELLEAALAAEPGPPRNAGPSIEGPRGPLQARRDHDGWRFSAPGAKEAAAVAADAMVWLEWSSALVVLASFDLSPWSVGE